VSAEPRNLLRWAGLAANLLVKRDEIDARQRSKLVPGSAGADETGRVRVRMAPNGVVRTRIFGGIQQHTHDLRMPKL